jgi:(E)-4-hydroxy-3-methylbut-2-enyl-diphosphate synthase
VASGNGKGQIFVRGEVVETVPEAQIVETLIAHALRLRDELRRGDGIGAAVEGPAEIVVT